MHIRVGFNKSYLALQLNQIQVKGSANVNVLLSIFSEILIRVGVIRRIELKFMHTVVRPPKIVFFIHNLF